MRVFFAHPKAWDDGLIDDAVIDIAADMRTSLQRDVTVVPGRDDFQANIAAEGNFDGWCRSITRRTDQYGKWVYDVIAVPRFYPDGGIGKATSRIAQDALRAGLPVVEVAWPEMGGLDVRPVIDVEEIDSEDYFTGWRLVTTNPT